MTGAMMMYGRRPAQIGAGGGQPPTMAGVDMTASLCRDAIMSSYSRAKKLKGPLPSERYSA